MLSYHTLYWLAWRLMAGGFLAGGLIGGLVGVELGRSGRARREFWRGYHIALTDAAAPQPRDAKGRFVGRGA